MELYTTEARKLDTFISENLQPNEEFLGKARRAIDIFCEFLWENCFKDAAPPQPRVMKVIKGGSLGKGTAFRGGSEANLVVFLSVFKDYIDQDTKQKEIVQEIGRSFEEFKEKNKERLSVTFEASMWLKPRMLSFTVCSDDLGDSIEFDVLPAFDALGQYKKGSRPDPQVYVDLIKSCPRGGEFSTCFTELQKEFIKARPPKLKSLICLLKYWYKKYVHPHKTKLQDGESLPPKYALELLAVYAWEQGSLETDFDMAEGFRTVLLLLQQYRQLCIFWTTFYDFENETLKSYLLSQLQKPRPVILDPADPTGIVGEGSRWDLLAQEAEHCSRQKCYLPHWDVLVQESSTVFSAAGISAPVELYETPSWKVDKFIFDHLQPDKEFLSQVRWAIDIICEFLKKNCFKEATLPQVRKVVKGGSSGKGTALKGGSDADLVVFLSVFKRYKDQMSHRKEMIEEIKRRLEEFKNKDEKNIDVTFEQSKWSNPRVLSFTLHSDYFRDSIEFDVLPSFDALGVYVCPPPPPPQVYIDLITSGCQGGEFSTCFTELQKEFIIDRPPKLKSLIRLLKHWYKEVQQLDNSAWALSLPPEYALELLAVYAWEKGSGKTGFDMAEGFRTVLWLLQQYKELCIFWTKYYDFKNETLGRYLISQLRKPRPVILDPADPTGIVGEGSRWDLLAQEAEYCLKQKCCTNYSVHHWDVPAEIQCNPCNLCSRCDGGKKRFTPATNLELVDLFQTLIRREFQNNRRCFSVGGAALQSAQLIGGPAASPAARRQLRGRVICPRLAYHCVQAQVTSAMFSAAGVSAPMELYETLSRRLDKFIADHLQPNEKFLRQVRWAIHIICDFLKNSFKDAAQPQVLKVVKGGSLGKGTALKGGSDANLVVFLSVFKRYKDQEFRREEMIQEIEKRLIEFKNKDENNIDVMFEQSRGPNPRVLSFTLHSDYFRDSIEFDVLPAFDALGQRISPKPPPPPPQVYIDLITSGCQGGEFSTCFTELQKEFIVDRPPKLKSLIRLLKHWYKKVQQLDKSYKSLPPKYVLELLAVYAWEKGSGKTDFDMVEGFRTVLWLLQQYKELCIFWTKYYDFKNETLGRYLIGQLRKPRPVILDPADPTGIVGEGSRWDLLAQEAEYCLKQKCCTNYSVHHWDVPVMKEEEQSYCTIL
uniref:2'-5'-oligoadenylate synthase 3-like n=1 Tax=Euleptes europaea TaxID=460621 RepID=UPI0025416501|nr:2'-5'-oligoadenylate synthase 3-like [Euleptes europaea]